MSTIDAQRLGEAVRYAAELHGSQTRKGGDGTAPYMCHLLIVAGQVLEFGGSEDQAIAGLLHDAIEDCDGVDHGVIAERFGEAVAEIVSDCTDTLPGDTPEEKGPWRERKERYLEHLSAASDASLLVAACDKCHNLTAMVGELRATGLSVLQHFKGSPEGQVWYYTEVVRHVSGRIPRRLQLELETLVRELTVLIQGGETKKFRLEG